MLPFDTVLPVLIIAALGYIAGLRFRLDTSSLSKICVYILMPVLVFNSVSTSKINFSVAWKLSLGTAILALGIAPLLYMVYRLLGWPKPLARAMLLPSIFSNSAIYGLPVCLFAFGQEGMDLGVVFVLTQTIITATLGVYIAASGKRPAAEALTQMVRMPMLYAAIAALLTRATRIQLPTVITRTVSLLGGAGVPLFLIVLGLQLHKKSGFVSWKPVSVVVFTRLVLIPALAALVGRIIGLSHLPLKILVLQSAMPPQVNATLLAEEYGAEPEAVSRATITGTLVSPVTLPIWISLLKML